MENTKEELLKKAVLPVIKEYTINGTVPIGGSAFVTIKIRAESLEEAVKKLDSNEWSEDNGIKLDVSTDYIDENWDDLQLDWGSLTIDGKGI